MEFRKMVTITLYTRQQKRHWCIEQSFGLCGRGTGWDHLGEWHWNMYNIIYEMSRQSRFNARCWMLGAGALGRPRGMVPAGPSILKWWGPGLLWIPKTLELGLTLRDVWEVLLGWVASRGNRRGGCTSLLYSLLGWVCHILYLLMPEAQPGLQSVLVGI